MQRLHKIGSRLFSRLMFAAVLIMSASLSVPAMAEDAYRLLVKMKNNEEKAFLLSRQPVVSFTENECVINCENFTSYFDMSEIRDITVNDPTALQEIAIDNVTLDYTDPASVTVRGIPAGATVTLHSLGGMLLDTAHADAEGNARINMSAVPSATVCIISVNSIKNFKIYKK